MSPEAVNDAFGKALDHLKAVQTPKDGGAVEAAMEAMRDAFNNNPEFAKVVADKIAATNTPVDNPEGKQKDSGVKDNNPSPKGGIQAGNSPSSNNTTGQANGNSAGE